MKKAILILAVIVVALIGLTSYNASTGENRGDDRLLASIKQQGRGDLNAGGKKEKND